MTAEFGSSEQARSVVGGTHASGTSGVRVAGQPDRAQTAGLVALAGRDPQALPRALRHVEEISLQAMAELLRSPRYPVIGSAEIVARLGVAPRHAWLIDRWLAALATESPGLATAAGRGGEPGADFEQAYAVLGFPPRMARFHRAALARLPQLLRDEVSVQELLFADGDVLAALAAYQDNAFTGFLNAAAGELLREAAAAAPGPLRVVELGGGAGLSTAAALRALRGTEFVYLFTDVSRLFTVAATERFGDRVTCGLLDLNEDFTVEPGSADVVLAGNVLHNATHVGRTLSRIRGLLEPGGWLVFTESTRESPAVLTSMQFLLSGPVFLDESGWHAELTTAGFEPRFTLPGPGSPLAAAGQRLFLAVAQ
ncbi:class I SAM-dependent methyltransferase [Nonomuraea sp. B19D2]|uniref:class I SAM-dependent methyltransferase n=1 Tax=Nonomuraea sp. B19D2 TaxID=3159561 RepID=UPI0032D9BA69